MHSRPGRAALSRQLVAPEHSGDGSQAAAEARPRVIPQSGLWTLDFGLWTQAHSGTISAPISKVAPFSINDLRPKLHHV